MAEDVAYLRHSAEEVDDLLDDVVSIAELEVKDRAALTELVDSGNKNKLANILPYGDTIRGNLTFTRNTDDTVTVTASTSNTTNTDVYLANDLPLKAGTYVLSGCPAGGSGTGTPPTYKLQITGVGYDTGDAFEFTLSEDSTISVYIRIWGTYVPDNIVFSPMLCTKAAWDISEAYQPYRPSYQELYEMVLALGGGGNRLMSINREEVTDNETNETDNTQGDIS